MVPPATSSDAGRRLDKPPYLQVALDMVDAAELGRVVAALPAHERVVLEAGTPLIKRYGVDVLTEIRALRKDAVLVADLKTLDVGRLEVAIAHEQGADAAAVSGLAPIETVVAFIDECRKRGMLSFLDTMNVADPAALVGALTWKPDVVLLHRGIDAELGGQDTCGWEGIPAIKAAGGENMLVAVAGGITPGRTPAALSCGADIVVVGRAITAAQDVGSAAQAFLELLDENEPDERGLR